MFLMKFEAVTKRETVSVAFLEADARGEEAERGGAQLSWLPRAAGGPLEVVERLPTGPKLVSN